MFLIKKNHLKQYLKKYHPIQLRWDSKVKVENSFSVNNFGNSKGQEYERVLIYPTKPFLFWLKDNNAVLAPISRSKFYVAITRAKNSVGIIVDDEFAYTVKGTTYWNSE